MSQLTKRGLENNAVDGDKVGFLNEQWFKARNFLNNAWINIFKLNASDEIEFNSLPKYSGSNFATENYVDTELGNYIPSSEKGAADGVCPLDSSSKIDAIYLPSYVDDVLEYADFASLPVTGETGKIYITLDDDKAYRWTGSSYFEISAANVDSVNGQTGIVVLDTDDINEGVTNLYFTDTRAKTAAVLNTTVGNETDQAPSVLAMKNYVLANSDSATTENFVLSAGDISNGYIDLAVEASSVLSVVPKGFLPQYLGDDYTLSVVALKTRITFAGTMLTLVAGDKIQVAYAK